jgi:hypothetical protein
MSTRLCRYISSCLRDASPYPRCAHLWITSYHACGRDLHGSPSISGIDMHSLRTRAPQHAGISASFGQSLVSVTVRAPAGPMIRELRICPTVPGPRPALIPWFQDHTLRAWQRRRIPWIAPAGTVTPPRTYSLCAIAYTAQRVFALMSTPLNLCSVDIGKPAGSFGIHGGGAIERRLPRKGA